MVPLFDDGDDELADDDDDDEDDGGARGVALSSKSESDPSASLVLARWDCKARWP